MRQFKTVFMRGGTSKGCMFLRSNLPENQAEWDSIFLQVMGDSDPKQIDGMGGTVSSNNKIVVVWTSEEPGADVEYLIGQVIVGKSQVDYKSNCGNKGIQVNEDLAVDFKVQTKQGSERIARAAFEFARKNGKKNICRICPKLTIRRTITAFVFLTSGGRSSLVL